MQRENDVCVVAVIGGMVLGLQRRCRLFSSGSCVWVVAIPWSTPANLQLFCVSWMSNVVLLLCCRLGDYVVCVVYALRRGGSEGLCVCLGVRARERREEKGVMCGVSILLLCWFDCTMDVRFNRVVLCCSKKAGDNRG